MKNKGEVKPFNVDKASPAISEAAESVIEKEPEKIIIAFSGKKQSGKDVATRHLLGICGGDCEVFRFADALKFIIMRCFIPHDMDIDFNCYEDKDRDLPCGYTVRHLLQVIGTDQFRGLWDDVWVNALERQVQSCESMRIIVNDVRFPNEVEAVHRWGGKVIRFLRSPLQDDHISETALDDYDNFDLVIDNRDMTIEEQNSAVEEYLAGEL